MAKGRAHSIPEVGDGDYLTCPLCLGIWPVAAIYSPDVLTREHAPVTQGGAGEFRCITCRPCNNNRGAERAASLERRAGGRQTGSSESLLEFASAYLICFATLGYKFILDSALDDTRRIIRESIVGLTPCGKFKGFSEHTSLKGKVAVGAGRHPQSGRFEPAILVGLPSTHAERVVDGEHLVIVPRPGASGDLVSWLSSGVEVEPFFDYGIEWPAELEIPRLWDNGEAPGPYEPSVEGWRAVRAQPEHQDGSVGSWQRSD